MQSAVLAMIDSVWPSVRPSVRRWYHAKKTPPEIMEDSPMTLVSSRLTSLRNSKGNLESEGAEWERGRKNRQFLANKSPYLRNGTRYDYIHNEGLIGNRIRAFDWYQNHWPWNFGWPWTNLNGQYALWCRKDSSFGAHCTKLNEDRPIHPTTKMTTFWKYKVHAHISGGSSWRGSQMRVVLLTTAIFGDLSG